MITMFAAEKFLKSKLALFLGLIVGIVYLVNDNRTLRKDVSDGKILQRQTDSIHRVEINQRDRIIYNIQQQQKIDADNATQAEKYRTEKYENLYNTVIAIKEKADKQQNKKHNLK